MRDITIGEFLETVKAAIEMVKDIPTEYRLMTFKILLEIEFSHVRVWKKGVGQ